MQVDARNSNIGTVPSSCAVFVTLNLRRLGRIGVGWGAELGCKEEESVNKRVRIKACGSNGKTTRERGSFNILMKSSIDIYLFVL